MTVRQGDLLWEPTPERVAGARLTHFINWLRIHKGLEFDGYEALRKWSVSDLEGFWGSIWTYFDVKCSSSYERVLGDRSMPGAKWFQGAELNYAENVFARLAPQSEAVFHRSEVRPLSVLTGAELKAKVSAVAAGLAELGVAPGDRVCAYLPNIPETVVVFLAAASLGATWSSCSPDFGTKSVVDRFRQIEPKILLTIDGYRYGGKDLDRRAEAAELQASLPTVEHTFEVPYLFPEEPRAGTRPYSELENRKTSGELSFAQVPVDHPLWVLYSSGTTGLPKPIVQGHGGILVEHLKVLSFHTELGPEDRFFWFTTTGWMMWNYVVSGLLQGAGIVLFDGNPGFPDMYSLWKLAEEAGVTYFGTSAAYITACMKAGIVPGKKHDLSRVRGMGSTGSPLSSDGFAWVYEAVGSDLWLGSASGGTDICSCFVAGSVTMPVRAGEIGTRCLGVAMEAWDDQGKPLINQVGEMVVTEPMPSMPIYFWGDVNNERYQKSYFEMYPGVWRHGDFVELKDSGAVVIYGRSDSTLNRYGVRIGTSEIYRASEALPEIQESLVVNLEKEGGELFMPLFVVLTKGCELNEALVARIKAEIRTTCSPRHVPDAIFAVAQIPKTLNGKKMEIPVRRILSGQPAERAMSKDACQNPESIEVFVKLAEDLKRS